MTLWTSSDAGLAFSHCSAAFLFARAGTPWETSFMWPGISAHGCLEGAHQDLEMPHRGAWTAYHLLISKGRSFRGRPEPPIPPDPAHEGLQLSLGWLDVEEPDPQIPHEVERELAVDEFFAPVDPDSPDARWGAICDDLVEMEIESPWDGEFLEAVQITDYKSDWPADAARLQSLQIKGQAVVVAAAYPDAQALRVRIVNLRRREEYPLFLDLRQPDDVDKLRDYRIEVERACEAMDAIDPDPQKAARPGKGCLRCPFAYACQSGINWLKGYNIHPAAPALDPDQRSRQAQEAARRDRQLALSWVMQTSGREASGKMLREIAADRAIALPDGSSLGYFRKDEARADENAYLRLADHWASLHGLAPDESSRANLAGLLRALGLTAGNIRDYLAALRRGDVLDGPESDALEEALITTVARKEFGVYDPKHDAGWTGD